MRDRIWMTCLAVAAVGLLAAGTGACAGRGGDGAKVASVAGAPTTTTGGDGGSANGTVEFGIRGNPDDPKFKDAQKACQEATGGPFGSGGGPVDPKFQEAALKFSRCMREHGISKFPDPQSGGGLLIGPDSGIDPSSPAFKAAQKACEQLLPKASEARAPGSGG